MPDLTGVVVVLVVPPDDDSKRLGVRVGKLVHEKGDADARAEAVLIRFVMLPMLLLLLMLVVQQQPLSPLQLPLMPLMLMRRGGCVVVPVVAAGDIPLTPAFNAVVVAASDCSGSHLFPCRPGSRSSRLTLHAHTVVVIAMIPGSCCS